ncbi:MAG: glycosyltransferase family 9 protein [Candidatus Gastranaerophilales bacterium]|nr:glycosyltransferase family 9 protein [Candidatus Gastranaerophilales bacterium]
MADTRKALFINFGGIGDEVLFLPTLQSFKKKFPEAEITLALEPSSKSIKDLSPLIDSLLPLNIKSKNKYFELLKLVSEARKGHFDLVISSGGNKFISILLFLTGIKTRIGFDTGALSQKLLTHAVPLIKNRYAAEMYHELVKPLTQDEAGLPIIETEKQEIEANTVVIHPGVSKMSVSKNMVKTYSPEKWTELINKLIEKGKKIYLAGGPDDKEYIDAISENFTENSNFINYYGKTKNIMDLAKLIASKEVLICCDSAPMHIGIAVGAKVLAIFGPTDEKKLIPNSEKIIAIKNNSCTCRPCLWDKRSTTCDTLECLNIDTDEFLKYL